MEMQNSSAFECEDLRKAFYDYSFRRYLAQLSWKKQYARYVIGQSLQKANALDDMEDME